MPDGGHIDKLAWLGVGACAERGCGRGEGRHQAGGVTVRGCGMHREGGGERRETVLLAGDLVRSNRVGTKEGVDPRADGLDAAFEVKASNERLVEERLLDA